MPITKSAKKSLRQSIKRRKRNLAYKKRLKKLLKEVDLCVSNKDKDKAKELIPLVCKALDKMAKKGLLKENNVARKKSKITKKLNFSN